MIERERGRIGHPGGQPSRDACDEEHLVGGREPGEERGRDRQPHPEHDHQLAAVAVAQRAEPEHRRREPERVPHGDEVERRLRGVERLADVRQRDVRDRQVEVGDPRDDDQGEEDESAPARVPGRRPAPGPRRCLVRRSPSRPPVRLARSPGAPRPGTTSAKRHSRAPGVDRQLTTGLLRLTTVL